MKQMCLSSFASPRDKSKEKRAEAEEESSSSGSPESLPGDSASSSNPPPNKKVKLPVRKQEKKVRTFKSSWKNNRKWLRFDPAIGMWCAMCHAFRQHPKVSGSGKKKNALALPTKVYSFRNVKSHADGSYHVAAQALSSRSDAPMTQAIISLPNSVIPKAKALFRTVLFMARNGLAYTKLRPLLELQRTNGVEYDLRYASRYTPVALKYLAEAAREHLRRLWALASSRAIMVDEVKEAGRQWVSVTARFFSGKALLQSVIGVEEMVGEGRDATAIKDAVTVAFGKVNVTAWLDTNLVAFCVDGASVLLSSMHKDIQQAAPNAIQWYCASHRTQRVDFDVTSVPKADRADPEALAVHHVHQEVGCTAQGRP